MNQQIRMSRHSYNQRTEPLTKDLKAGVTRECWKGLKQKSREQLKTQWNTSLFGTKKSLAILAWCVGMLYILRKWCDFSRKLFHRRNCIFHTVEYYVQIAVSCRESSNVDRTGC